MLFLNGADIMASVSRDEVMEAVTEGYRLLDDGCCCVPDRAFYAHEGNKLIYMPCFAPGAMITKVLSVFPQNYRINRPMIDGVVLWTDAESGEILSIMDAKKITALRTAAAGGLAARYLSKPESETLGIVGAGVQGLHLALFAASVRPIKRIFLLDERMKDGSAFEASLEQMLGRRVPCRLCRDSVELLKESEIVITATTSSAPVLADEPSLFADKCLIGVGSYSPAMREYPRAVWSVTDTAYVDLEYAMKESGDLSQPIEEGLLKKENVKKIGTLAGGPVISPGGGRSNFFKTVGMSLVDLTTAAAVYKNALKLGIGQEIQA